jgi:adenylate cyclase
MAKKTPEEQWAELLSHRNSAPLGWLPRTPRCSQCGVPFAGLGGAITRVFGFRRWNKNPTMCNRCVSGLPDGGIETDIAVLFADLRGSTGIAEQMTPAAYASLLTGYYDLAIEVLAPHRAIIDKMIGDEVMALFTRMGSHDHRASAITAAVELARRFPELMPEADLPGLGVGVNAGTAFVGKVGLGGDADLTALGDTVNVAARLQGLAQAGQVVLGEELLDAAAVDRPDLERRVVELRGRSEPMTIGVINVLPAAAGLAEG